MASRTESAKPRALLTGRYGFTGRYVARELESAGYEVTGLARAGEQAGPQDVTVDLLDRLAVHQAVAQVCADVVVHLAAISFVAHGDAEEIYRVNIVGTRNLLEALSLSPHRPRLVVLASSANIYGNARQTPITEDTPAAPTNDYAISKLAMEQMARLWMDRLPVTIVRPFNYTGVGQSEQFLIPKIVAHFARHERSVELGNIHVWRDFSDVRDVAKSYASIVSAAPEGQTLNICSGVAHSLAEIIEKMERIADYRIEVMINPAFVRANEVTRLVGSRTRLDAIVGTHSSTPLPQTLEWMYTAMQAARR